MNMYYFAYGSNLNAADWARFCARIGVAADVIEPVGPAILPDWALCFDYYSQGRRGGALDIQARRGHIVHGVLYRASPQGWAALDQKEGAPNYYERIKSVALRPDGTRVEVVTYAVTPARRREFCAPSSEYRQLVIEGLQAWGLPVDGFVNAAENCPAVAEIDKVFVYGTLLSGQHNAGWIPAAVTRARHQASTVGVLYDTGCAFPAMRLHGDASRTVQGECLEITGLPELLHALDALEGFDGYDDPSPLFHRTLAPVTTGDGRAHRAWCYVGARPELFREALAEGCWRTHPGARPG